MIGNPELGVEDYLAMVRRRMWWIIVPAIVAPIVAFSLSLLVPNVYESQTLVLVEQQKVPESYVRPVVTEELNQRLATMQEQILSRSRLQPIIERFNLLPKEAKRPMEERVEMVRKLVTVSAVRGDFGGRTGGLPGFYIGFKASDPRLAQQVCGELTSMFLNENLRLREQNAEGTTDFIKAQLEKAKTALNEQDSRLAAFKKKYIGQLPGQEQTSFSMLNTLNTQLQASNQSLDELQRQKTYTETMLGQATQTWESTRSLGTTTIPAEAVDQRLAAAEAELVAAKTHYTDDHPDVIKLKRNIETLKQQLEEQNRRLREQPAQKEAPAIDTAVVPPQIQQLRADLRRINQTIRDREKEQATVQQQIRLYQGRLQLSPTIEEEYKSLTRDYNMALVFYDELLKKKNDSEMATNLERRQQGEQFRVLDPPNLPEKPSSPKRVMFAAGGFAGGVGLGVAIAFLLELRDKSIRTEKDVKFYLELPLLASVPAFDLNGGAKQPRSSKIRNRNARMSA